MQIYVGKNGQQLGPFSLDEVNRKVADGTFTGSDLAWYEGAAGWAALSGVPGVNIRPAPVAPAVTPAPAAIPVQPRPALAPAPIQPNASIVQPPRGGTGILALASWVLLGISLVVSFIPVVGCFGWAFAIVVAVAVIIMGIVMLTRGQGLHGGLIILAGILIVPICFAAQFLSLAAFGGTYVRKQEKQILENLGTINTAKMQWAADTKASKGAPVTMASLTKQLSGYSLTPAVGETYDPMPVGQAPTATLPSDKTLGKFKGGDVLTVASLETALANSSIFDWLQRITPTPAPSAPPAVLPKPSIAPSVSSLPNPAAPSVTAAPSVSASPRPSTSPRSSSSPHLLISPRQSVEPRESPSSRPSPSAKFAPRVNPRQSPGPSEDKSPSDNSGGLKQGRQYPGDTPAPSPDDNSDG
jgi:uncharacterized protein DUF4339